MDGRRGVWLAVAASLLPFAYRAGEYALVGSIVPLLVLVAATFVLAGGWALDGAWERRAVRLWTAGMVLWGVARLGLLAVVKLADPPGLGAQMHADLDVTFALVSTAYVVAGILLWRGAAAMRTGRGGGSLS